MQFSAQAIPEVISFISEHYKGGSVIDYGCGTGRYTNCFPASKYVGIDGSPENIAYCQKTWPDRTWILADLEKWTPNRTIPFEYLFSSVVFDQVKNLPKDWAKTYILIEPKKYEDIYKPQINIPLDRSNDRGTRMMICKKFSD